MRYVPVFDPVSPQGRAISELFFVVLVICGVILAIVTAIVVYSLLFCRGREGAPEPRQVFGNRRVEIIWTVVPFLTLVLIFVMTVRAMRVSDAPPSGPPDIVVVGHQWWWEVRYRDPAIVTANEIHVPAGKPLLVQLESADVIHDFWAPQLARKMDMVPGATNYIWLQADHPRTYLGACAEYCGTQHAWMRFEVIAQTPTEFAAWAAHQAQPAPEPTTDAARRGRELFLQMTCANCHSIQGVSTVTNVAPDLTHLASRRTLGAGVVENTPTDLARWLKNPQSIKPGCRMPNLNLTDAQVDDLVNYFDTLK